MDSVRAGVLPVPLRCVVSVNMRDKFQQSLPICGWCLFSVLQQSGGCCRYATEAGTHSAELCTLDWLLTCPFFVHVKVVDYPVVAQRQFPLVLYTIEILQLQYIDQVFDVLVAQVQQICANTWETVEIPQLQLVFSWTSCCSPVVCNDRCPRSMSFAVHRQL